MEEPKQLEEFSIEFQLRKDIGLSDLDNSTIKCADCNKKLLLIKKVKDTEQNQTIQAKCFCGGSSFKVKLAGKFCFIPENGLVITSIIDGIFVMEKIK